jgi:hypothetical protein
MSFLRRFCQRRSSKSDPATVESWSALGQFAWLLNREPTRPYPTLVESVASVSEDDQALVQRVMAAYRLAFAQFRPSGSGWDRDLVAIKKDIHIALLADNSREARRLLQNPAETTLFWGFDAIAKAPAGSIEPHEAVIRTLNDSEDWRGLYALWLFDALCQLGEALGARRVSYLETEPKQVGMHDAASRTTNEIVDQIDAILGIRLRFPNPFAGELGLPSSRGVIGFRAIQAVYQAWRIAQIINKKPGAKVLEIGAGLGRTAYYANLLGISNYRIIDIPLTNAAQGYFLGRVLGPSAMRLYGEQNDSSLSIMPSTVVEESTETYDLIVNVDSWTEMTPDVAKAYWGFAKLRTRTVLSINHEHNPFTVRSMYSEHPDVRVTRHPYWVRRGYVEEVITW